MALLLLKQPENQAQSPPTGNYQGVWEAQTMSEIGRENINMVWQMVSPVCCCICIWYEGTFTMLWYEIGRVRLNSICPGWSCSLLGLASFKEKKITKSGNLKKMFQVVESKMKQNVQVEELNGLRTHTNEKVRFKGWSYYSGKALVYHEQGSGSTARTPRKPNQIHTWGKGESPAWRRST